MRAVPSRGADGCAFAGPGVDLRGDDASEVFETAAPIVAWLAARAPGARVRSLSLDLAARRILVTFEAAEGETRPSVLRFDPPAADELIAAAKITTEIVGKACARALAKRGP